MINFLDFTCSKTDLIAIARISLRGAQNQLLLRKLPLERLRYRDRRICRARHTHCLINVTSAGKRIADGAAKAGRRTAERLDFRRMIVCLVLEEDQPLLALGTIAVISLNGHDDRAGIVFMRLLAVCQLAVRPELLHADNREVHQAREFIRAVFVKLLSGVTVALIGCFHRDFIVSVLEGNIL